MTRKGPVCVPYRLHICGTCGYRGIYIQVYLFVPVCPTFCLSFICQWTSDDFYVSAFVNDAAMNIGVQRTFNLAELVFSSVKWEDK
jgi:hypothetical protein